MNKTKTERRNVRYWLTALFAVLLCIAIAVCSAPAFEKSKAYINNNFTGDGVSTPIYDYANSEFNEAALGQLAGLIIDDDALNQQNRKLNDLIVEAENAGYTGAPVASKHGIFAFGQYQVTGTTKELVWEPVYLSKAMYASEGTQVDDAILTVWLAQSVDSSSAQSLSTWTQVTQEKNGLNGQQPNMYGTSYLRSTALGQPGGYYTFATTKATTPTMSSPALSGNTNQLATVSSRHAFSEFIRLYDDTVPGGGTKEGLFYSMEGVITRPASLYWQEVESAASALTNAIGKTASSGKYSILSNSSSAVYSSSYDFGNEAWGTGGNFQFPVYDYASSGNSVTKKYYSRWKDDTLWIPSVAEVGVGGPVKSAATAEVVDTNGLWQTDTVTRSNGLGKGQIYTTWLRSVAINGAAEKSGKQAEYYGIRCTAISESQGTSSITYGKINPGTKTGAKSGVRPALHINLSAIARQVNTVDPDIEVETEYNGEAQDFDATVIDKYSWYPEMFSSSAELEYYHSNSGNPDTSAMLSGAPTDAGEYFVYVTLSDNYNWLDKNTNGASAIKSRYIKYTIKPKVVYAVWQYTHGNIPTAVLLSSTYPSQTEFTFYERDTEDPRNMVSIDWCYIKSDGNPVVDENGKYVLPTQKSQYKGKAYLKSGINEVKDNVTCNYVLSESGLYSVPFDYTPTVKVPTFADGTTTKTEKYRNPENESANDDAGIEAGQALLYQISNFDSKNIDYSSVKVKYGGAEVSSDIASVIPPIGLESDSFDHVYLALKKGNNGNTFNVGTYKICFSMKPSTKANQYNWTSGSDYNTDVELTLTIQQTTVQLLLNKGTSGVGEKNGKQNIAQAAGNKLKLDVIGAGAEDGEALLKTARLKVSFGNKDIKGVPFTWNAGNVDSGEAAGWVMDASKLSFGNRYTLTVHLDATTNYKPTSSTGDYVFYLSVVNPAKALDPESIVWQVSSSQTGTQRLIDDTNGPNVIYSGYSYVYSLAIDQKMLDDSGVYLTYAGNTATNAGMYTAIAKVCAIDPSVSADFEPYTISLDYKIEEGIYDLSGVAWNEETIDTVGYPTLSRLPSGLKVSYVKRVMNPNGRDVSAEITAEFSVKDGNYKVPKQGDTSSYYVASGTFQFSTVYTRTRTVIQYVLTDPQTIQNVYILPTAVAGDDINLVTQRYVDSSNVVIERFVSGTKYRLLAEINDKTSYVFLKGSDYVTSVETQEFTVPPNVTTTTQLVIKANGAKMYAGQQFGYSGKPIQFTVESSNTAVVLKSDVRVIDEADPNRVAQTTPPTAIGKYTLVVSVKSVDGFQTDINYTISYEIVRAKLSVSDVYVVFTNNANEIVRKVHYLETMGGWYDTLGNSFDWQAIPYISGGYKISFDLSELGTGVSVSAGQNGSNPTAVGLYRLNISSSATSNNYDISSIAKIYPNGGQLSYQIIPGTFDLSKIRWNIEVDGAESTTRTDFSEPLAYAPNYQYKVKIYGLPTELDRAIRYSTYDASDTAKTFHLSDNTAIAQGSYRTYFYIEGNKPSFTTSNYNPVKLTDIMVYLNNIDFLTWSIAYKDTSNLSSVAFQFDGEKHNVYDLFSLTPVEKKALSVIEIVYRDSNGQQTENYPGYENQKGILFHAGKYQVRFSDPDQTMFTTWGTVNISALNIAGEWKLASQQEANYDMFFLYDSYSQYTDLIEVIYTDRYGVTYPDVPGAQSYYTAEVMVKSEYVGDITLSVSNNGGKTTTDEFFYTPWQKGPTSQALAYPAFEQLETTVFFDGIEKIFSVKDFDSVYGPYLNVNGSWTATEIGKYTIIFTFKPNADAYWLMTDNQSPYSLSFEIVKRDLSGLTAVKQPTIDVNSVVYSGEPIEFMISNLSDKCYIIEDVSDSLTQTNIGLYWIKVALKNPETMYWEGTEGSISELTLTFQITRPGSNGGPGPDNPNVPVNPGEFIDMNEKTVDASYLYIDPYVQKYTGEEIEFKIKNWSYFSDYIAIKEDQSDSLVQTKTGWYQVTVGFLTGAVLAGWHWSDGSTANKILKFMIMYEEEYMQWVNDNTYDPWENGTYPERFPPVPGEDGSNINNIIMYVLIGFGVLLLILAIVLAASLASSRSSEEDLYEDDYMYDDYNYMYDFDDSEDIEDTYEETDDDYDYDYGYEGAY